MECYEVFDKNNNCSHRDTEKNKRKWNFVKNAFKTIYYSKKILTTSSINAATLLQIHY